MILALRDKLVLQSCQILKYSIHTFLLLPQLSSQQWISFYCVTIAVELKKDNWKNDLCVGGQKFKEHFIIQKLNTIENVDFKKEVVELFERSLKIVQEHLKKC